MAGSLFFLPQRLMVSGETRKSSATSLMVSRSGKSESDMEGLCLFGTDIFCEDYKSLGVVCQYK